jgi:hypothetical protein
LGRKTPHWSGAAMQVNVAVEQLLAVQLYPARNADVPKGRFL